MAGFTIILSKLKDFVQLLFSPQRAPFLFITRSVGVPGPPFFRRASAIRKPEAVDTPGMGERDARAA
jgi:hypothetical protein